MLGYISISFGLIPVTNKITYIELYIFSLHFWQ
jgi:hypothetical protein